MLFLTWLHGGRNVRSGHRREAEWEVSADLVSGIWAHCPGLPATWPWQSTRACNLELISGYQSAAQGVASLCSQTGSRKQGPGQKPSQALHSKASVCCKQPFPRGPASFRVMGLSETPVRISDLVKPEQANVCMLPPSRPPGPSRPIQAHAGLGSPPSFDSEGWLPRPAPLGGSQVSAVYQDPASASPPPQTENLCLRVFRPTSWSYTGLISPTPHHTRRCISSAPPSHDVQSRPPVPHSGLSLRRLLPGSLQWAPHQGPCSYHPPQSVLYLQQPEDSQ